MFTGIIEEIGIVKKIDKNPRSVALTIEAAKVLEDTLIGDSIATDGVCLTVTHLTNTTFTIDIMYETLNRSTMKSLKIGSKLNLERALTLNTRLGGHMVSGHIDGVGTIKSIKRDDIAHIITIEANQNIMRYILEKGSIAIDGISLTVVNHDAHSFSVWVIPHTKDETTLLSKKIGDKVNLEADMIGKYVEKLFPEKKEKGIDEAMLKKYGF